MFFGKLGKQNMQLRLLLTTIGLAACIPNLGTAADKQPSDYSSSPAATSPSTPAPTTSTTTTTAPAPAMAPAAAPATTTISNPANTPTGNGSTSPQPQSSSPPTSSATPASPTTTSSSAKTTAPTTSNSSTNSTTQTTPTPSTSTPSSSTTSTTTTSIAPSASIPATSTTSTTTTSTTTTEPSKKEIQVTAAEKQKAIVDFLKKAAEYIKENGKESSLAEFNKKNGIFSKDSLYVFAINYDGIILATLDTEQKFLGTNQLNYKDPDGLNVVQRLIEKAKSGGGWLLYKAENPATKAMECKYSYVMPGNIAGNSDYLIGTGYYYAINPKTNKCEIEK